MCAQPEFAISDETISISDASPWTTSPSSAPDSPQLLPFAAFLLERKGDKGLYASGWMDWHVALHFLHHIVLDCELIPQKY